MLLCAFFILLVIIPGFLYLNFGDSAKRDEGGVLLENKRIYGALLNENLIYKNMPQILARSLEFEKMAAKSKQEISLLTKLKQNENIYEMLPKTVSRKTQNMNLKPLLLILANLYDDEALKNPEFRESIDYIRKMAPHHIDAMLETGMELNTLMR